MGGFQRQSCDCGVPLAGDLENSQQLYLETTKSEEKAQQRFLRIFVLSLLRNLVPPPGDNRRNDSCVLFEEKSQRR